MKKEFSLICCVQKREREKETGGSSVVVDGKERQGNGSLRGRKIDGSAGDWRVRRLDLSRRSLPIELLDVLVLCIFRPFFHSTDAPALSSIPFQIDTQITIDFIIYLIPFSFARHSCLFFGGGWSNAVVCHRSTSRKFIFQGLASAADI